MKQCILFSRVSTLGQDLVQQTNELKAEASRLGYAENQQIHIEYKESAIKLSIDERKGIQELKDKIENNPEIDCVVIYEISRLSRQTTMLYEIRDYLIERQIQLVCLKPYFRLLENGKMSQTASILFSLFSSLSESEMMIKKERMMRGRLYKRDSGKFIGGNILFGYKIGEDDKIEIDYKDAEIVRKIFNWYNEGKSFRWIAYELLERGLGPWTGISSVLCSIKRLVRRPEYKGDKGKTYPYPRIISDELYDSVNSKITKSKPKCLNKGKYLAQGLMRDKKHNLSMACDGIRYTMHRDDVEEMNAVNKNAIDKWIWELCEKRAKNTSKTNSLKRFLHDTEILNAKIQNLNVQVEKQKGIIDKINERIIKGRLNEEKGDLMIEENENEINRLKSQIDLYTEKLANLKIDEVDLSDKKSVVNNEIEVIYVNKLPNDGKYRIKELEVHFRDGSVKKYNYIAWSRFIKIAA